MQSKQFCLPSLPLVLLENKYINCKISSSYLSLWKKNIIFDLIENFQLRTETDDNVVRINLITDLCAGQNENHE